MELKLAQRKQAKIKLGIQGCSGSGKTMGALLIAYGLCNNWGKVAVIDTENYSASLYSHLGGFSVLNISAPYTPEKYIDAIRLCEQSGMEAIVIDSLSMEWDGIGGILDTHGNMPGNSFTNWSKLTPRHEAFIQAILQSSLHVIGTVRSKQEYVLNERNGKQVPEKVGLKGIQRQNLDYEMTIMLEVDINHNAKATKDRTGLFADKPEFTITFETGRQIKDWCELGAVEEIISAEAFADKIESCMNTAQLKKLYLDYPKFQQSHLNAFNKQKLQLEAAKTNLLTDLNYSSNGNGNLQP